MRYRIIWLLAQVGFWAGRWVGRIEARTALANHQNMVNPHKEAQRFVSFVRQCQSEGMTHAEIAQKLDISTAELRGVFSWVMSVIEPTEKE